jgi:hypothetical protein
LNLQKDWKQIFPNSPQMVDQRDTAVSPDVGYAHQAENVRIADRNERRPLDVKHLRGPRYTDAFPDDSFEDFG